MVSTDRASMSAGRMDVAHHLDIAWRRHREGKLAEALSECDEILRRDRHCAPALDLSGRIFYQLGDFRSAEARIRAGLAIAPARADAWSNLAVVLEASGRPQAAADCLRQALKLDPQAYELQTNLSAIEWRLARPAEAETAARRALAGNPRYGPAWYNLALALQAQRRTIEALDAVRRAVGLEPNEPSHAGLQAQLEDALGATDKALSTYETALARNPFATSLRFEYAGLLDRAGDPQGALAAYGDVLRREPSHGPALSQFLNIMRQTAVWEGLYATEHSLRSAVATGSALVTPFVLLASPSTRAEQRRCADTWCRQLAGVDATTTRRRRLSSRRLRIGYLSGDFYSHATAFLTAGLFEAHDRGRFEISAYSIGPDDQSPMRARLVRAFDRFVDARFIDAREIAATIRAHGIDILVDLKGHTAGALPKILALRPAPIQVHYLGYPGTLGSGQVDYLVGDAIVTPPEHAPDYAETLVRLPGCYQVNDRERPIAPTHSRAALGLPDDAMVFCNFNATYKINPAVLDVWAEILHEVPGSVLWLLAPQPDHPAVTNLQREANARGIDPARLVFAAKRDNPDYLALFRQADLFLDTWPYNAHTTASDALWAGCPVLTMLGSTFAGRVGASLVTAVGLPELVTRDAADYASRAIALAANRLERDRLRDHLANAGRESSLFDTRASTRALEQAYLAMAEQYRRIERLPIDL